MDETLYRDVIGAVEKLMARILLSLSVAIGACSAAPRETAMDHAGPPRDGTVPSGEVVASHGFAAQGPMVEAVSAAGGAAPAAAADPPGEAAGRRILSTAFVMIGADRLLTVGLRDGRSIVLRNVAMRANDYCGTQVQPGGAAGKFCGRYADVANARPGAAATFPLADPSSDATGVEARPNGHR